MTYDGNVLGIEWSTVPNHLITGITVLSVALLYSQLKATAS